MTTIHRCEENLASASTADVSKTKRQKSNTLWDQCELSISTERYYGSILGLDSQRPGGDLLNKSLENSTERHCTCTCANKQIPRDVQASAKEDVFHPFAPTRLPSKRDLIMQQYEMHQLKPVDYSLIVRTETCAWKPDTTHDSALWTARIQMGCPSITVVLTAVPCALLNPTHPSSSLPPFSLSINAPVFLDPCSTLYWRRIPSSFPSSPPLPRSVSLSAVTPTDRCLYFRLLLCPWTLGCPVFDGAGDSQILKCMRSHMLAGATDCFLSRNKSLHHQQTEDSVFTASTASGNHWAAADTNSDSRHF